MSGGGPKRPQVVAKPKQEKKVQNVATSPVRTASGGGPKKPKTRNG